MRRALSKGDPSARIHGGFDATRHNVSKSVCEPLLPELIVALGMQALWSRLEKISVDFAVGVQVGR